VLNTAVAQQLKQFKADVDALIKKGETKDKAIFTIIKKYIKACKAIHFDGNGYSKEWEKEAAKRGLDCEKSTPKVYDAYLKKESIKMFEEMGVMTERELKARNEVKWETYSKKIAIESRVLGNMAKNHIIPVALRYQSELIDNVIKMKELFGDKAQTLCKTTISQIESISKCIDEIKTDIEKMVAAREKADKLSTEEAKANAYHDDVEPFFDVIRASADELEFIVDNEIWPLPKYRELLFIR
jgi:glutamine synthetase